MNFSPRQASRAVLVVDDEGDVLDFLKYYLESLSWQVMSVDSPLKAFEMLEKVTFFCVLTDIAMPDMDGYEFISEIRKRLLVPEIILMTGFGYNPRHSLLKLHSNYRFPCLFKPFNKQKLADTVAKAYDSYHKSL
jgi:CheY-like chemotaxis protein